MHVLRRYMSNLVCDVEAYNIRLKERIHALA